MIINGLAVMKGPIKEKVVSKIFMFFTGPFARAVGNEVTTCCHHVYDIIKVLRCHLTPQMASVSPTCTLSMAKWLFDLLSGTMLGK